MFKGELAPVTLTIKKKEVKVETDEHPRPQTTIEGLKKLPPVFKKEGIVTAGTASVSLPDIFLEICLVLVLFVKFNKIKTVL